MNYSTNQYKEAMLNSQGSHGAVSLQTKQLPSLFLPGGGLCRHKLLVNLLILFSNLYSLLFDQ